MAGDGVVHGSVTLRYHSDQMSPQYVGTKNQVKLDQGHLACRTQLPLPGPVALVCAVIVLIVVVLLVVVLVIVLLVVVVLIVVVLVVVVLVVVVLVVIFLVVIFLVVNFLDVFIITYQDTHPDVSPKSCCLQ